MELKRSDHSGNSRHLEPGSILLVSPFWYQHQVLLPVLHFQERQSLKRHWNRYHNLGPYFKSLVSLIRVTSFLIMKYWFHVVYKKSTVFLGCFFSTHGTWRSKKTPISKEYFLGKVIQHHTPSKQLDPIIIWLLKQEDSDLFLPRFLLTPGIQTKKLPNAIFCWLHV